MLDRLRHLRSRQLIAFLAMIALAFAMTSYAAHLHRPDAKAAETTHCELCAYFASTGGPAKPPELIVRVVLVLVRREIPVSTGPLFSVELPHSHRSRAPPVTHLS